MFLGKTINNRQLHVSLAEKKHAADDSELPSATSASFSSESVSFNISLVFRWDFIKINKTQNFLLNTYAIGSLQIFLKFRRRLNKFVGFNK